MDNIVEERQMDLKVNEEILSNAGDSFNKIDSSQKLSNRSRKDSKPSVMFPDCREDDDEVSPCRVETDSGIYPFAMVLRIRVLQIVCGITALIMGTVACIEERAAFNLGIGIAAGGATVLAAAVSIHNSRGFGGYRPSSCAPGSRWSSLRFLGSTVRVACSIVVLWGAALTLHSVLMVQAAKTLIRERQRKQWYRMAVESGFYDENSNESDSTLTILAAVQLTIGLVTLITVLAVARVDCRYDPD